MTLIEQLGALAPEMCAIRQDLHAHPETAFEEIRTSALIAQKLRELGLSVATGVGKTGVIGTLKGGAANRSIGLRADMDALNIEEATGLPYRSKRPGKMHACGHDGHMSMLLGAAKYLAHNNGFDGTIHFIFQPAEENEGGCKAMLEDGLLSRFPMDAVFGLHNIPGIDVGHFASIPGPMMASFDVFEIEVEGRAGHAAMPHLSADPVLAASALVVALQSIVSRTLDPLEPAVISVTQLHSGNEWNVIPQKATLRGTVRAFSGAAQDLIEASIRRMSDSIASSHRCKASVRYERRYPPTVNNSSATATAHTALSALVDEQHIRRDVKPSMAADDFGFFSERVASCYAWVGSGLGEAAGALHSPTYDFNDAILPIGAAYWVQLARTALAMPDSRHLT